MSDKEQEQSVPVAEDKQIVHVPAENPFHTKAKRLIFELGSVDYDQEQLSAQYTRATNEFLKRREDLVSRIKALLEAGAKA